MRRFALDSNVLLYAELESESAKGQRAARLIGTVAPRGLLSAQVIGEFLNVVRRRAPLALVEAQQQAELYRRLFAIIATDADILLAAASLAQRYKLQFWDATICQASLRGGAAILFSEDFQDGFEIGGMRVVNPFAVPDWSALASLIGP